MELVLPQQDIKTGIELQQDLQTFDCCLANRAVSLPHEHDFLQHAHKVVVQGLKSRLELVLQEVLLHLRVDAFALLGEFVQTHQELHKLGKVLRHKCIRLSRALLELFKQLNDLFNLLLLARVLLICGFLQRFLSFDTLCIVVSPRPRSLTSYDHTDLIAEVFHRCPIILLGLQVVISHLLLLCLVLRLIVTTRGCYICAAEIESLILGNGGRCKDFTE